MTLTATAIFLLVALACGASDDSPAEVDLVAPLPTTLKPAPPLRVVPSPTPAPALKPTPVAGEWVQLAPRANRRVNFHAAPLPDGRILIFGGSGDDGVMLTSEIYDPETDTWSESGDMVYPITASTRPITLSNGHILVVDAPSSFPTDHSQIYDPESGEWSQTGPLNNRRNASTGAPIPGGDALVIGGASQTAEPTDSVERFDAKSGQWKQVADTPLKQRFANAALLLDNGTIALIGEGTALSDRAAIYNPSDDTWTETAPMNEKRRFAALWALPGARVLAVGGFGGAGSVVTAEIYDSVSNEWTLIGDEPGSISALGTLSDGRALGIGFDNESHEDAVLIYDPENDTWEAQPFNIAFEGDGVIILTPDDQIFGFAEGNEFLGNRPETWAYRVATR